VRALGDIACTVREPQLHDTLQQRAPAVIAGCQGHLTENDVAQLRARAAAAAFTAAAPDA